MTTAKKLVQIAENERKIYDKGFEDGKAQGGGGDSYYDTFWDSVQENGKRTNYNYGFYGWSWNDTTFKPKYNFNTATSAISMFQSNGSTEIPELYMPSVLALTNAFSSAKAIKIGKITVSNSCTFTNAFAWESSLVNIEFGSIISNAISFANSTKLSKESIEDIINHLSETTTGLSITLSKTAVNNAFGIDVDDLTTYPEGSEYYILRHSRDNWTINYA